MTPEIRTMKRHAVSLWHRALRLEAKAMSMKNLAREVAGQIDAQAGKKRIKQTTKSNSERNL